MTTLTLRAHGDLPAAQAWERYARPELWARWAPQISRVDTSADRIAAGVRGRVVGPFGVAVTFVVEDVDEVARTWVWRVRLGLVRLRLTHGIEFHDGGGSATWLRVSGPLPIVLGYAPVAVIALRRLVAR